MSRLSEYAVHRAGCTSNELGRSLRHCDCGLKEALKLDASEQAKLSDYDSWSWAQHRTLTADLSPTLPVPRLEIRYESITDDSGYTARARYALVYRHLTARDDEDRIVFVPLGQTKISGAYAPEPRERGGIWQGRSYGPFRDGDHIRHDMRQLKLPGFIIGASGDTYEIDLNAEDALKKVSLK